MGLGVVIFFTEIQIYQKTSEDVLMVGEAGLEPARLLRPTDFKSVAYTDSATRPYNMEARMGVAPIYEVLQTSA